MTEMVKIQEKHSQNNIAEEISEGKRQQFTKLFFRRLKTTWNQVEEKDWRVSGWCEATNELETRKQLLFTEDNTFGLISALQFEQDPSGSTLQIQFSFSM